MCESVQDWVDYESAGSGIRDTSKLFCEKPRKKEKKRLQALLVV